MNKELKYWLINHIQNHPNISFGSLHRDACYSRDIKYNSHDGSLSKTLKILISENIIIEINKNNDSFYISLQSIRDNKLNVLINENNN